MRKDYSGILHHWANNGEKGNIYDNDVNFVGLLCWSEMKASCLRSDERSGIVGASFTGRSRAKTHLQVHIVWLERVRTTSQTPQLSEYILAKKVMVNGAERNLPFNNNRQRDCNATVCSKAHVPTDLNSCYVSNQKT